MSLQYLIDGYNVINQIDGLVDCKLEVQRERLVQLIEMRQPQGKRTNKVTVVFDGQEDVYGSKFSCETKVIFSKGETADDKIKKIVAQAKNKKNIIVVTDDRDIQYAVRREGAKISSTREFISKLKAVEQKSQKTKKFQQTKNISRMVEQKITEEFKDVWLKGNRGKKSA